MPKFAWIRQEQLLKLSENANDQSPAEDVDGPADLRSQQWQAEERRLRLIQFAHLLAQHFARVA